MKGTKVCSSLKEKHMSGGRPGSPSSHHVLGRQGFSSEVWRPAAVQRRLLPSQFPSGAVHGLLFQGSDPLLLSDRFFSLSFPLGSWIETRRVCSSLQCLSC